MDVARHGRAPGHVEVLQTDQVGLELLRETRDLLDAAFSGEFTAHDWSHALGGWHVLVRCGDLLAAHAAVVPRVLYVGDRKLSAGYVEAVATSPPLQRQGYGTAVMHEVGSVLRRHVDMGALSTGEPGFYGLFGWVRWQGRTFVETGSGRLRTADEDDGIMVLRFAASVDLPLTADLTCEQRPGHDW